jgi:predicted nucleic acid-binding protein
MMMESRVCVDASFMVALLMPERFSQTTLRLWEEWVLGDVEISAPSLLRYEVISALYRKALRSLVTWEDSQSAQVQFLSLDIDFKDPKELPAWAVELARFYQRPNTCDAFYLALADHLDCKLWTADERLYNAVSKDLGYLRWLGELPNQKT